MVGLYYKRREARSQNKSLHLIGKSLLGVAGLIMVGFIFIVFFFNGERIKGPVSIYLGSMLESKVTIGSADFSPLYPYVMRLSDVRFGGTRINELYVEYEIGSLFSSKSLNLIDLYINGLTLDEEDLNKFKQNRFKHDKIQVQSLRLNHIPLKFKGLSSKDVNLRLTNAVYDNQGLNFTQGTLSALEAELYEEKITNLSVEFKHANQGYLLSNLSVNLLGGTVSGMGMFYPSADALTIRKDQDELETDVVKITPERSLSDTSQAAPVLAAMVPLSAAAAALPKYEASQISLADLNFSLIKSAYAAAESPNNAQVSASTGAQASTDAASSAVAHSNPSTEQNEPTAPEIPAVPARAAVNAAARTAQRSDKSQVANTFTASPSQIENDFAAVGEKLPFSAADINKFRGLADKRQDPCAYQNLLSSMQPSVGHLDFDELYLTKLVLPRCMLLPGNFAVTAKIATLSDVIITNQTQTGIKTGFADAKKPQMADPSVQNIAPIDANTQTAEEQEAEERNQVQHYGDFVIQGINGHIKDFKLDKGQLLGTYNGMINEISLPHIMTVFEQNRSSLIFTENGIKFEMRGHVYEGSYQVRGNYDNNQTLLNLSDLRLAKTKLELTKKRWDYLRNSMSTYQINLGALSLDKLEFLSYINSFPVSVQSISGNAANLKINNPERKRHNPQATTDLRTSLKESRIHLNLEETLAGEPRSLSNPYSSLSFNVEGDPSALLNLDLTNALYSDLLMRKAQIMLSLSDDILHVSIPKLHFNESELSAQAKIGLVDHNAQSHFELDAKNFEIADFNSNLINHLLTGKVNVSLNLDSQHNGLGDIFENLTGQIQVNSDALLISDLGIDLINGGPKKDYKLTGTELMTAVQGSVAGINNLTLDINFADHKANVVGKMGLATSNAFFDASFNLQDQANQGMLSLESLAQDSATQVLLEGTWDEPVFKISALQRGEPRPGLYLPQYEATAIAKEQTDTILKNFEGPIPPSLQAPVQVAPDSAEPNAPSESSAPDADAADIAASGAAGDSAAHQAATEAPAQTALSQGEIKNSTTPDAEQALTTETEPTSQEEQTPAHAQGTQNSQDAPEQAVNEPHSATENEPAPTPAPDPKTEPNEPQSTDNQANAAEPAALYDAQTGTPEQTAKPDDSVSVPLEPQPEIDANQVGKNNPAQIYEDHEAKHNDTTTLTPSADQQPKAATNPEIEQSEDDERYEPLPTESAEPVQSEPEFAQSAPREAVKAPAPQADADTSEHQDASAKTTETDILEPLAQEGNELPAAMEPTDKASEQDKLPATAPQADAVLQDAATPASAKEASDVDPSTLDSEPQQTSPSETQLDTTGSEATTTTSTTGTATTDQAPSTSQSASEISDTEDAPQTAETQGNTADTTTPDSSSGASSEQQTTESSSTSTADHAAETGSTAGAAGQSRTSEAASVSSTTEASTSAESTAPAASENPADAPVTPVESSAAVQTTAHADETNTSSTEPSDVLIPESPAVPSAANEALNTQDGAHVTQPVDNPHVPETTNMELKPSDSVHLSTPAASQQQSAGSNAAMEQAADQQRQHKQAELEQRADEIEDDLLQAAVDSFFTFKDEEDETAPATGDTPNQDASSATDKAQDDYEFNNSDDEMIF